LPRVAPYFYLACGDGGVGRAFGAAVRAAGQAGGYGPEYPGYEVFAFAAEDDFNIVYIVSLSHLIIFHNFK
jgi:hypothetical protein